MSKNHHFRLNRFHSKKISLSVQDLLWKFKICHVMLLLIQNWNFNLVYFRSSLPLMMWPLFSLQKNALKPWGSIFQKFLIATKNKDKFKMNLITLQCLFWNEFNHNRAHFKMYFFQFWNFFIKAVSDKPIYKLGATVFVATFNQSLSKSTTWKWQMKNHFNM